MDPALQELLEYGEATDEVAIVVRLRNPAEVPQGLHVVARLGPIVTARIERAAVWQFYGHPAIVSIKAPRWLVSEYGPVIDAADAEQVETVDTDQRRPDDVKETGRGSVVGLVDWGCDFAHPDFVEESGVSRLLALWDQRAATSDSNPYGYGRVLRKGDLTAAIKADDPYVVADYHPSRSDTGVGAHGTHVLSIAAGNGRGGGPVGIAPEADLIFVHLGAKGWEKAGPLGDSSNLLEAIHFIVSEAGDRPLVLNMSIGRHAGPHDGSTLVELALDWLVRARPGTAVVQSTGNYFARNVHSAGVLRNGEVDELSFVVNPGDTTPNELEVWYPGTDVFQASLIAPDGKTVADVHQNGKARIVIGGARVGTLYHRTRDPNNADHQINLFQYPNAPAGTWRLIINGIDVSDGRYHAWLERDPGCNVCQALFPTAHAEHKSTTGSICNGMQTIAVGAYDGHDPDHRLAPFSSSGPTRDGRVRPVVLAPGVRVLAARSQPKKGTASLLTRMSGTSMAAPHVTGTIALMFEAGGRLDIVQIRRALFEALGPVPSEDPRDAHRVGFGILDTTGAVRRAAELGPARAVAAPATPKPGPDVEPEVPPPPLPRSQEPAAGEAEATPVEIDRSAIASSASPDAASDAATGVAEAPLEAIAPESEKEIVMNPACCGEKCKSCEHCKNNSCETCPCCHPAKTEKTGEAVAESGAARNAGDPVIQVVPSPLEGIEATYVGDEQDEANEPIVQVVPSPFEGIEATDVAEQDEANEPLLEVVPSPLESNGESLVTESVADEALAMAAEGAPEVAVFESTETESSFPHTVEAAEGLLEAGVEDGTEFLAQSLATAGRAWPAGCTVRSLFDDLAGRTTRARRHWMDQHFEVIGRPGRRLAVELQAGDIVIRRGDGGFAHPAIVAHPLLYTEPEAREHGLLLEGPWPGFYAHVVEPGVRPHRHQTRFARRLSKPDGSVLSDTLVVRARGDVEPPETEAAEAEPDPNIRWLQSALNRLIDAGLVVDGLWGPATRGAVRNYQESRGLLVDGIVGPQTSQALHSEYDGYAPPTYPPPPPYRPPTYTPPPAYKPPPSYRPPEYKPPPPPYRPPTYTPPPAYKPPPPYRPPEYKPPPPPPYRPPTYMPPPAYRPPAYTPPPPPPYRPPTYTPPPAYRPPTYTPPPPPYRPPTYMPPPAYRPPTYTPPPPPYRPPTYTPPPAYRPPTYAPPPPPPYRPPKPPTYSPPEPPDYDQFDEAYGTCRNLDKFGYDSAVLTYAHRGAISELAQRIVASRSTRVTICGYASPEGTESYNLALGQRRAEGVAAALRESIDGVRAGTSARIQFDIRSEGESRPISNDGPTNRRVEVCYADAPQPRPPGPTPRPPGPTPRPPPRPPPTRALVRYSVETAQGQAMLSRYEEAVRRMMALPASNPSSWVFQWYVHWIRSDRNKAGEINSVFGSSPSPARALADRMWNTCRAHQNFSPADEAFFLPWHRMYVYYFERICRQVLNDPAFTLPYWNYTSGSTVLPAPFRNTGSPLFRADRNAGPNQGRPIDAGQPRGTLSADRALALPVYDAPGDEPGFNDFLDRDPHGTVHGLVGNGTRGMGTVPWAAQDPIFWLHHCNIDRIWASWNNAGRRNPTAAGWLGRSFTFADENGRAVTATVRDFTTTAARGYGYDRFEAMPRSAPAEVEEAEAPSRTRSRAMGVRKVAAPSGGIPLGGNAIKVNLRSASRESAESDEAGGRPKRVFLVLRNYRANAQPGIIYHVYLDLPPGTAGQAAERHYVGPLSFFDAVPHAGHAGHFTGRTARFDVTDIAERLRAAGKLSASPSVTIAPAGQPVATAQPVIGEISLVEQ